ncbi:hypothetical protein CUJ91_31420 [Paraburkholderia graminis]|nr:hypothetical protein CUJ91_31420 [Paraburkholderia graminis]
MGAGFDKSALHRLARALAPLKGAVLQTLADMALNLLGAGSAGISLRESGTDGLPAFRSAAL